MYPFTISAFKTGITRLRRKAGASADALWDLVNSYINAARSPVPRPGTKVIHTLPAGTIGLTVFDGKRHVYSTVYVAMTDPLYVLHVLPHPTNQALTLKRIDHAEPLMGYLFVVAEYSDGSRFSFYLTEGSGTGTAWTALTVKQANELVRPTAPNGFYYAAKRLTPPGEVWAPSVKRAVNDVIEPTTFNGFEYVAIEVIGDNPRSGLTEPAWSTTEGGVTNEDADNADTTPTPQDPGTGLPGDIPGRYPPNMRGVYDYLQAQ